MKNLLIAQFVILLAGTMFSWGNFGYELNNWINTGKQIGCAIGSSNPFYTPCFFGAIFFSVAFILSALSLKKFNK